VILRTYSVVCGGACANDGALSAGCSVRCIT